MATNLIGKSVFDLPTPSLVVDLDQVNLNLRKMQQVVSNAGGHLRPHIKTHKCSTLAKMQIAAGAIGITCATLGEAEAMAAVGIRDILIANQLVTNDKLQRVALLQEKADVKFVVDSAAGIRIAQEAGKLFNCRFEVLLEVDNGGKRCGVQTPEDGARLTRMICDQSSLSFGGIQAYNGGLSYIRDLDERERECQRSTDLLRSFVEAVSAVCMIPRISGAGTGHVAHTLAASILTEIQSGTYIYSDATYCELAPEYRPAVFVLSTVLSTPTPTMVVMDAGLKTMGTEFSNPKITKYPGLDFDHFSEEHAQWQSRANPLPQIGEKVLITPSHCCTTVNHYRKCFVVQADIVQDTWTIDAF